MSRPLRRTQAERSGEMRARLAEAAYDLIAERGHSAFRMAAVAERAGVSVGALLHHFPSKEDVTLAAIDHALCEAERAAQLRADAAGNDPRGVLEAIAADFIDFFMGDRFWVSLDITMDALKNPDVGPAIKPNVARSRGPVFRLWSDELIAIGWDRPRAEEAVRSIAAIVSGYSIRKLWTDDGGAVEGTLARWFDTLEREP